MERILGNGGLGLEGSISIEESEAWLRQKLVE